MDQNYFKDAEDMNIREGFYLKKDQFVYVSKLGDNWILEYADDSGQILTEDKAKKLVYHTAKWSLDKIGGDIESIKERKKTLNSLLKESEKAKKFIKEKLLEKD